MWGGCRTLPWCRGSRQSIPLPLGLLGAAPLPEQGWKTVPAPARLKSQPHGAVEGIAIKVH